MSLSLGFPETVRCSFIMTLHLVPGHRHLSVFALLALSTVGGLDPARAQAQGVSPGLKSSLTFHASFDHGLNADFAKGSRQFSYAPSIERRSVSAPGLPPGGEVTLAAGAGKFGDALRFERKSQPIVFFSASTNLSYRTNDWAGTVSFWLKVDPKAELAMGYADAIQITPRAWNDAAFFIEFEKRTDDVPFRLGVYPDFKVWNPNNRKWEEMSAAEKPLVTIDNAPFSKDRWTHVVFTFEHFNTGKDDGICQLYLDGRRVSTLGPRRQTFMWNENDAVIMMGLSFIGLWDELAVFNRALSAGEVRQLNELPKGVAELHP